MALSMYCRGASTSRVAPRRCVSASASFPSKSMLVNKPISTVGRLPKCKPNRRAPVCNGLFGLGLPELAVIAGVAALVFGPSKLPEIGKGLGKTVKSFQSAAREFEQELKTAASETAASAKSPTAEEEQVKKSETKKEEEAVKKVDQ